MRKLTSIVAVVVLLSVCRLALAGDALTLRWEPAEGRAPQESVFLSGNELGLDIWAHCIGGKTEMYRIGPNWFLKGGEKVSLLLGWAPNDNKLYLSPTWSSSQSWFCDDQLIAIEGQIPLNKQASWAIYSPETRFLWQMGNDFKAGISMPWSWNEGKGLSVKTGPAFKTSIGQCSIAGRCIRNFEKGVWEGRVDLSFPLKW